MLKFLKRLLSSWDSPYPRVVFEGTSSAEVIPDSRFFEEPLHSFLVGSGYLPSSFSGFKRYSKQFFHPNSMLAFAFGEAMGNGNYYLSVHKYSTSPVSDLCLMTAIFFGKSSFRCNSGHKIPDVNDFDQEVPLHPGMPLANEFLCEIFAFSSHFGVPDDVILSALDFNGHEVATALSGEAPVLW